MNNTMHSERLHFIFTENGFQLDPTYRDENEEIHALKKAFAEDPYQTLYNLGFVEKPAFLDPAGSYLYRIADAFARDLAGFPDLELLREKAEIKPEPELVRRLIAAAPFVPGAESVRSGWIEALYQRFTQIFRTEIQDSPETVQMYIAGKGQNLKVAERIFFHLVENRGDPEYPFAFLATYATTDESGGIRHYPLKYALTEYKGEREKLLELLSSLNRVADVSPLLGTFVSSGELFHPLKLTADEAYDILCTAEAIERTGIIFRIPNWWKKNNCRVTMQVTIGEKKPSFLGMDTVLQTVPSLNLDGETLSKAEIRQLLAQTDGLALLKGKWVRVDRTRLQKLLADMQRHDGEMSLLRALRIGMQPDNDDIDGDTIVTNGEWLDGLLTKMRSPETIPTCTVPRSFRAALRPYQKNGLKWLDQMASLGFGCCLADDMGLGKTVQVLAYLERLRKVKKDAHVLLVVPTSLMSNWIHEKERFAPQMPYTVFHGPKWNAEDLTENDLSFLNITTYGINARTDAFAAFHWDCVICDEAQAIKNPAAKQTRQVKKLPAAMRIAMTGTPIENDLTNLWSLFDFLNKGLLGSSAEFGTFCKSLDDHPEGYAKLRRMISPFMLRRVKTDKSLLPDLPDKLEQADRVELSKKQVVLYKKYVAELADKIENSEGIERRGLILASLVKLKQICNHPDQYLGQESFDPKDSGKFAYLREICETIYEKRERVLVFTQFRELTPYLDRYLESLFHCKGLVLHGGTPAAKRGAIVEQFQGEAYIPYMVLSVKAGGTGLNLTNASHVVHFDRWWNPAVENQATDRAYRIGQKNNVIVHKLISHGTIEERIDALIESKKELADAVIQSGGEQLLTEMSNSELLSFLRLDM